MKINTKDKIINFAQAVELLAQSVIHQIGDDKCSQIMMVCEELKEAIETEREG